MVTALYPRVPRPMPHPCDNVIHRMVFSQPAPAEIAQTSAEEVTKPAETAIATVSIMLYLQQCSVDSNNLRDTLQ